MTMADVAAELKRPAALWRDSDPNLRRLILAGFFEMLSVNAYFSLIVPFAKTLGLDSQSVGALNSVLQIVSAVTAVVAGVAADRASRKLMYVAGQIVRLAITLALLATHSYVGLIAVFALRGLVSVQIPAQQAMMAGLTQRSNRATMLALWQTLSQLASVLMPLAAGVIADVYGARMSFLIGGVLAAVAIAIGVGLKEQPVLAHPAAAAGAAQDRVPLTDRLRHMFGSGRGVGLSFLLGAGLLNGIGNGAMNIILPFTIMDRFSSAYAAVASSSSVMAFGTMLVLLIGGRMADLGGRRRMVMVSGFIFPLIMLPIFIINAQWQLSLMLILVSMVGNISSPAIGAVSMEAVEDRDRATFAGLQMGVNACGNALGSVLAGIAYLISPSWSWAAVIAAWFLQVGCYHFVLPHDSRRVNAKACEAPPAADL